MIIFLADVSHANEVSMRKVETREKFNIRNKVDFSFALLF